MPERVPILSPVAGAVALGVSALALVAAVGGEVPGNAATWTTVVLGAGGGLLALLRPGRIWAAAGADTLVGTAAAVSLFGVGMYELVPLVLLGLATVRTPHRPVSAPSAVPIPTPIPARALVERAEPAPVRRSA